MSYVRSFWRLMIPSNIPVANIMGFQCEFMKYSKGLHTLKTDLTVHYFMVAVARQAKGRLLKEDILLNAFKIARSVGVDSVTYICTSRNDQERARRVGFMASNLYNNNWTVGFKLCWSNAQVGCFCYANKANLKT